MNKFLLYLLSFFYIAEPFAYLPSHLSSIVQNDSIDFAQDLDFIKNTLMKHHPGPINSNDPNFTNNLEKNFLEAKARLLRAHKEEEKVKICEDFGKSFDDGHLWVYYDKIKRDSAKNLQKKGSFTFEEISKGIYWLTIPTFQPKGDEIETLKTIIEDLNRVSDQTIIFDLRGNGGGNSAWGDDILISLFGKDYVQEKLSKTQRNVSVEWRISQENVAYIKRLYDSAIKEFGENHPSTDWIKTTADGMSEALKENKDFYLERFDYQPCKTANESPPKGKYIAIIDHSCASATLDFLDGLKAMEIDLTLIGKPTGKDTLYMEVRSVELPSGKGRLGFPIKVYQNRARGHNTPHLPDIEFTKELDQTPQIRAFILDRLKKDEFLNDDISLKKKEG